MVKQTSGVELVFPEKTKRYITDVHHDAQMNQAILTIFDQYGDAVNIKREQLYKFGTNTDLNTGTAETIWNQGGTETLLTTNTITQIVSSSTADTVLVKIEGHTLSGDDFTLVVQSVPLAGQTPVALTTPLARVSRIYNVDSSDLVGIVVAFDTTGSSTEGVVTPESAIHLKSAGNGSEKAATTFSASDYGILTGVTGGMSGKTSGVVDFELQIREVSSVFRTLFRWSAGVATVFIPFEPYLIVPKNSDIRIVGLAYTNNTTASASFSALLGIISDASY